MPTFEEGEATEDSPYDRPQRRSPKRRKSLFAPDLGDSEAGGLRGKVQLTFEESLKKAAAKKKTEASKAPKNLDFFFSSSKATDQSKKEKKKEIAVDDFFASSTSCKVGQVIGLSINCFHEFLFAHALCVFRLQNKRNRSLWSQRRHHLLGAMLEPI